MDKAALSVKLLVTPINGLKWSREDGSDVDMPPPFELDIEVMIPGQPFQMAQGHVRAVDHPLSGRWVVLLQRHDPTDGACNLYVVREKLDVPQLPVPFTQEREAIGYANAKILS